jgi:hypothetical protein
MLRHILLFIFLTGPYSTQASSDTLVIRKDLIADWMIYEAGSYQPFNKAANASRVIYFYLPETFYRGDYLFIESHNPLALFINGLLVYDSETRLTISLDSLANKARDQPIFMAIYQNQAIQSATLTTRIGSVVKYQPADDAILKVYGAEDFKNFVVVVMLVLAGVFTFLVRLNPAAAGHYFSLHKLLSLRESDDSQSLNRMTSSSSILFYVFSALLSGFVMMLWYEGLPPGFPEPDAQESMGFIERIIQWSKVCGIILVIFFAKAVLIFFAGALFGMNDLSGFQFSNFMRVILITMALLALVGTFNFLIRGDQSVIPAFLFPAAKGVLAVWLLLIFLKLVRRVPFTPFHLFSYICATELIPLVIVVNLLYER